MKSLRSTGSVDGGAGLAQVVERAGEVERLGEDGERRGAAALVGAHDVGHLASPSRIGPADGERRLCSAISETPGRVSASENGRKPSARRSSMRLELGQRRRLAPPLDLVAGVVDDPVQARSCGAAPE